MLYPLTIFIITVIVVTIIVYACRLTLGWLIGSITRIVRKSIVEFRQSVRDGQEQE